MVRVANLLAVSTAVSRGLEPPGDGDAVVGLGDGSTAIGCVDHAPTQAATKTAATAARS